MLKDRIDTLWTKARNFASAFSSDSSLATPKSPTKHQPNLNKFQKGRALLMRANTRDLHGVAENGGSEQTSSRENSRELTCENSNSKTAGADSMKSNSQQNSGTIGKSVKAAALHAKSALKVAATKIDESDERGDGNGYENAMKRNLDNGSDKCLAPKDDSKNGVRNQIDYKSGRIENKKKVMKFTSDVAEEKERPWKVRGSRVAPKININDVDNDEDEKSGSENGYDPKAFFTGEDSRVSEPDLFYIGSDDNENDQQPTKVPRESNGQTNFSGGWGKYFSPADEQDEHPSRRVSVGDMWLQPQAASSRLAQQSQNNIIEQVHAKAERSISAFQKASALPSSAYYGDCSKRMSISSIDSGSRENTTQSAQLTPANAERQSVFQRIRYTLTGGFGANDDSSKICCTQTHIAHTFTPHIHNFHLFFVVRTLY